MGSAVFSSTYRTNIRGTQSYNVRVSYSESYDWNTNKSTVAITAVELQLPGNGTNWGQLPFFGTVKAGGTAVLSMNGGAAVRVALTGGEFCAVAIPSSESVEIAHNADGTGSFTLELVGGFVYEGTGYFCALYNNEPFGAAAQSKSVALTPRTRQWSVAYHANGGSGAPAAQTKTYNQALTLSATRPSRASASAGGYTVAYNPNGGSVSPASAAAARTTAYSFLKWNTAADGSGTDYAPGGSYTADAAATLYAQWTASTSTAALTLPTPTRSGYAFNGWYTAASGGTRAGGAGESCIPSGDTTLYAQWTALASTIASCSSSVATQGSFQLSVARSFSAYYHKATFKVGSTVLATSSAFAASLSYTVPRSWFNGYPSSSSLSVTVSVQTYTDSSCATAVGSPAAASFTVTADALMKPTLLSGWATAAPYNTGAAAGKSGYIKGYSRATVTFDASKISMANGAALASYSVSCQGETTGASPYRTPVLNETSVSLVCTVTDSRGRSSSQTLTLSVYDYANPSLSGISVFRCGSNGTASEDGTCYSVRATASCSPLGGQNGCTLSCALAAAGGAYGTETTLASGAASVLGTISADASYTVRLTATDALGNTALYYASVPSRKWAMKFRPAGSGVAFGKAAEHDRALELPADWSVLIGNRDILEALGLRCRFSIPSGHTARLAMESGNGTEVSFLLASTGALGTARAGLWHIAGYHDSTRMNIANLVAASSITITPGTSEASTFFDIHNAAGVTVTMSLLLFRGTVSAVTDLSW